MMDGKGPSKVCRESMNTCTDDTSSVYCPDTQEVWERCVRDGMSADHIDAKGRIWTRTRGGPVRAAHRANRVLCVSPGTVLRHHSGRVYTVLSVANKVADDDRFPATVNYIGANGELWARKLSEFTSDRYSVLYDGTQLAGEDESKAAKRQRALGITWAMDYVRRSGQPYCQTIFEKMERHFKSELEV